MQSCVVKYVCPSVKYRDHFRLYSCPVIWSVVRKGDFINRIVKLVIGDAVFDSGSLRMSSGNYSMILVPQARRMLFCCTRNWIMPALIFPFWMRRKTLNSKAPQPRFRFLSSASYRCPSRNLVSRCFDFKS